MNLAPIIYAHRGVWSEKKEQNTKKSLELCNKLQFGVETDFRSFDNQLLISHDSITKSPQLKVRDVDFSNIPIAINIKEDGLHELYSGVIKENANKHTFLFDGSIPEMLKIRDIGLPHALRLSEYEKSLPWETRYIWIDSFVSDWWISNNEVLSLAKDHFLVFVSPEIHGREWKLGWEYFKVFSETINSDFGVCTDYPIMLKDFLMGKIKAVLFDMDGVLIDAKEWHYMALNEVLEIFGFTITRDMHNSRYDGLPTKTKLRMLEKEFGLPSHLHSMINRVKQDRTLRIAAKECYPNVSHQILISKLKANNVKIAIVTNSVRQTTEFMLTYAGLYSLADLVITNEDVSEPKPNPECYVKAMQILGVSPSETVIVEDSPYGIQAARDSRANVLEVAGVNDVNLELFYMSEFAVFND